MCECQGNPLARVTLALGLPYLLVNRALAGSPQNWVNVYQIFSFFTCMRNITYSSTNTRNLSRLEVFFSEYSRRSKEIVRGYLWRTYSDAIASRHTTEEGLGLSLRKIAWRTKRHWHWFCRPFPKTNHVIRCSCFVFVHHACQYFLEHFSEAKALSIIWAFQRHFPANVFFFSERTQKKNFFFFLSEDPTDWLRAFDPGLTI